MFSRQNPLDGDEHEAPEQLHRFDHRHVTPMHSHARGHLVYPATGVLSLSTRTGSWIVPTDRIGWVPAGAVHQHRVHGRVDMRVVYLESRLAAPLPDHPAVLIASPLAREAVLALTAPPTPGRPVRTPEQNLQLRTVVLDEVGPSPEQPLHLPVPHDPRLRQVAEVIAADLATPLTLGEIGAAVGSSERTLSRLFREELGMGYRQWRTQFRVHEAMVMLASGRAVLQTGTACGWRNASAFTEAFKRLTGQTPGEYKKSLG